MTKPTHSLTPEQERAINEVLCQFMGEGFTYYDSYYTGRQYISNNGLRLPLFTRSLDTLRLVEERLTPEQWLGYVAELDKAMDNDSMKAYAYDDFSIGVVWALQAPVSLRAAALKEVVGE